MEDKTVTRKLLCKLCNDVIETKGHHDFQKCNCGNIFIDTTGHLIRFGYKTENSYQFID